MSVLDSIIEGVRLDEQSRRLSEGELMERIASAPKPKSALENLRSGQLSLIAEIKRSSPSKGNLSEIPAPNLLARIYEESGAAVISVLTEERRFNGSLKDFALVRNEVSLPILRKDFMVSEYLIRESRAFGADVVLLIVAALSESELQDFYTLATELGMDVLVEIHDEKELERALAISPKILGVNSRNLRTLDVDTSSFDRLLPQIPNSIIKVAESGISNLDDIRNARKAGADAVLVGEALVRSPDPGKTIRSFLESADS
ncbi:MAG: indole-3-glycerol phosphate synthase TrpC [Candidatus Nanopelagicaceae bacterium]|nr:indole-3-glycerol phosphate synthase TrpC [Candidatus Nanopelagicaceae bacterium]